MPIDSPIYRPGWKIPALLQLQGDLAEPPGGVPVAVMTPCDTCASPEAEWVLRGHRQASHIQVFSRCASCVVC